jgi:hypothetical protein
MSVIMWRFIDLAAIGCRHHSALDVLPVCFSESGRRTGGLHRVWQLIPAAYNSQAEKFSPELVQTSLWHKILHAGRLACVAAVGGNLKPLFTELSIVITQNFAR